LNTWKLLKERYPAKEYALLSEVRNAAGYNASRSADGIVVGFWPSRGCEIEGIELKSGRGDWLNELKNPAKAEAIFKFCDRWWIVAEVTGIVKLEEVPSPWGFMEVVGEKLKVIKPAPKLEPVPLKKEFVVSMLKRMQSKIEGMITKDSISAEILKAREEGKGLAIRDDGWAKRDLGNLRKSLEEFELKSGIKINEWNGGNCGSAVKKLMQMFDLDYRRQLLRLQKQSKEIYDSITEVISLKE